MGQNVEGGMIVGCSVDGFEHDDINSYADSNGMVIMHESYDCDSDGMWIGFEVDDILVSDMDSRWLLSMSEKARKFKELTGCEGELIGMQNIT